MNTKIRKLNNSDLDLLDQIEDYRAKIVKGELQLNEENNIDRYTAYGIFLNENILIGFCGLVHADDSDTYQYWDESSKVITELFVFEEYEQDVELYCELFDYILFDQDNKDINIFYDNNINLQPRYYEQLGFQSLHDGVLVRLSDENIIKLKQNKEDS